MENAVNNSMGAKDTVYAHKTTQKLQIGSSTSPVQTKQFVVSKTSTQLTTKH